MIHPNAHPHSGLEVLVALRRKERCLPLGYQGPFLVEDWADRISDQKHGPSFRDYQRRCMGHKILMTNEIVFGYFAHEGHRIPAFVHSTEILD